MKAADVTPNRQAFDEAVPLGILAKTLIRGELLAYRSRLIRVVEVGPRLSKRSAFMISHADGAIIGLQVVQKEPQIHSSVGYWTVNSLLSGNPRLA